MDTARIQKEIRKLQRRPADYLKRGRKAINEDVYLSETLHNIDKLMQRIEDEKDSMTQKQANRLRNQAAASRSRVQKKLEDRAVKELICALTDKVKTLIGFLGEDLPKK